MSHGRHRQNKPATTVLPPAAVGVLASAGVVLAVVNGNTQVLRLAVLASWALAVGMAGWSVRRSRAYTRSEALSASARRRDEAVFAGQLGTLQDSLGALQAQVERLGAEAGDLRHELLMLHADKAETEEALRRARARQARHVGLRDERVPFAGASLSTVALSSLHGFAADHAADLGDVDPGGVDDGDWVSSWLAGWGAGAETVVDLTMHDDTIPLDLPVEDARSA